MQCCMQDPETGELVASLHALHSSTEPELEYAQADSGFDLGAILGVEASKAGLNENQAQEMTRAQDFLMRYRLQLSEIYR